MQLCVEGQKHTVVGTEQFRDIAKESIERGYNRLPSDDLLESLAPEGVHLLVISMPHEHIAGAPSDLHMRTIWMMMLQDEDEAATVAMDMPWECFTALPEVVLKDGRWKWVQR